jgi:RNA polymerase sigma-70 factor, ECF subfamily
MQWWVITFPNCSLFAAYSRLKRIQRFDLPAILGGMSTNQTAFPSNLAAAIVRRKAITLVGKAGYIESDLLDIQADLLTDLLVRWRKYDPTKGKPGAFIASLVEHKVASLLRHRRAKRRHYRRCCVSLNTMITDPDGRGVELAQTLSAQGKLGVVSHEKNDVQRAIELRADVASILAQLPPNLRKLCTRIGQESLRAIARREASSRWSVQKDLERIRESFVRGELCDYLQGH